MTKKVKYSHPLDGRAHFSQDGQIRTTVWNHAQRLDSTIGHFFSLDIAGASQFRNSKSSPSTNTASCQFSFDTDAPVDPVHFAGYWLRGPSSYRPTELMNPFILRRNDGQFIPTLVIAPPSGSPLQGGLLAISARTGFDSMKIQDGRYYLIFTGGFAENLSDENEVSSFLALQYPVEDVSALPSVDYQISAPGLADYLGIAATVGT
jgi:hypothetical protein